MSTLSIVTPAIGTWNKKFTLLNNRVLFRNFGLLGAAEGGHLQIVKFFVHKGATMFHEALALAKTEKVVDYLREKIQENLNT